MKMLHYKVLMVFIFQEPPSEIIAATCEDVVECLQTKGNMVVAGNLYMYFPKLSGISSSFLQIPYFLI